VHYQSGNFVECVHFMNQILQKKPKDPKVPIKLTPILFLLSIRITRCLLCFHISVNWFCARFLKFCRDVIIGFSKFHSHLKVDC
jgi:hypothetical protein